MGKAVLPSSVMHPYARVSLRLQETFCIGETPVLPLVPMRSAAHWLGQVELLRLHRRIPGV